MNPNEMGLLQLINAAVTPVVMISACATLIIGINTKHSGAADRVREIARRYRDESNADRGAQSQSPRTDSHILSAVFNFPVGAVDTLYCGRGVYRLRPMSYPAGAESIFSAAGHSSGALFLFVSSALR